MSEAAGNTSHHWAVAHGFSDGNRGLSSILDMGSTPESVGQRLCRFHSANTSASAHLRLKLGIDMLVVEVVQVAGDGASPATEGQPHMAPLLTQAVQKPQTARVIDSKMFFHEHEHLDIGADQKPVFVVIVSQVSGQQDRHFVGGAVTMVSCFLRIADFMIDLLRYDQGQ